MTATGTAMVSARFRGGTGKNRKRSGDDTSELHVWWSGCSDRYKSHGNKFQGCT